MKWVRQSNNGHGNQIESVFLGVWDIELVNAVADPEFPIGGCRLWNGGVPTPQGLLSKNLCVKGKKISTFCVRSH